MKTFPDTCHHSSSTPKKHNISTNFYDPCVTMKIWFRIVVVYLLLLLGALGKHVGGCEGAVHFSHFALEKPWPTEQCALVEESQTRSWPAAVGLGPLPSFAVRTQPGAGYYLRHVRSCACGTLAKMSAQSKKGPTFHEHPSLTRAKSELENRVRRRFGLNIGEQRHERRSRIKLEKKCLRTEACKKRLAECTRLRRCEWERGRKLSQEQDPNGIEGTSFPTFFGGGLQSSNVADSKKFKETLDSFLIRSQRMRIRELGDGHCGIRSLFRQLHPDVGTDPHGITAANLREGRQQLAEALLNNCAGIVHILRYFGTTVADVSARANLHSECNTNKDCDSKYWVGGTSGIDFIAWAMHTQRCIYIITAGSLQVNVYSPNGLQHEELLASVAPGVGDAVLEYTGDHFNTFVKPAASVLPGVSNSSNAVGSCPRSFRPSLTKDSSAAELEKYRPPRCCPRNIECALFFEQITGRTWSSADFSSKAYDLARKQYYRFSDAARKRENKEESDEASEPQVTDEVKQHAVNEAVGKLTGDAASRGLRPTGHITSISDDVKARIQKEIDLFEEEKKQRRGVCACCDELCKRVHEVHITEEWVERLKRRLPWMAEVPASLRDQYNVAKVDARLSSLASVPLSPRGVIRGDARCQSRLSFCASCYRSIRRSSQRTPPKFAIANGWEIGDPPKCFTEAT